MEFKLTPIEVPVDDPFKFDALNRKASVEALTNLLNSLKGPFVLTLDSPWGTGKTTFIRIWKAVLESQNFACLYFNAWEKDFSTDPLVAFLGEFEVLEKDILPKDKNFKKYFNKAKKLGTAIARRALPLAGKIATSGILDIDEVIKTSLSDIVSGNIKDAVDAYLAEKDLIGEFHKSLSKSIATLRERGKKDQLIVFVDEVDRCRPTFAIELLERIKHLFNIENVIFVLSLDKSQLSVSLKAIYGVGLDSDEYLRRFIDLEYALPKIDSEAFTRNLFNRFGFEAFFAERKSRDSANDRRYIEEVFIGLSDLLQISLRTREQCFTRIRVAMMMIPQKYPLYPHLFTTLVTLKAGAPEIYRRYMFENGIAGEVVKYLQSLNGGPEFLDTHPGKIIEAYLIAAKSGRVETPEQRHYREILENQSSENQERERATWMVSVVDEINFKEGLSLGYLLKIIELAGQVQ
jgi:vacuolar-type H+-ATPase subunit I/STV1